MIPELYTKNVSAGGRVTFTPFDPNKPPEDVEVSDRQILTMTGTVGMILLKVHSKCYRDHQKAGRKVLKVLEAVRDLYSDIGGDIEDETAEYIVDCWNMAARLIGRRRVIK